MPSIELENDCLKLIIDFLRAAKPNNSNEESRLSDLAETLEAGLTRMITVICREVDGTHEPLIYEIEFTGTIHKLAITKKIREIRREELGSECEVWVERLTPMIVLDGTINQLADYRAGNS